VYGIAGDSGPYDMMLLYTGGSCCADDANEENDDWASATTIDFPDDVMDGQVCSGDEDWFTLSGTAASTSRWTWSSTAATWTSSCTTRPPAPARLLAGISDTEQLEADLPATGDYYLRVLGYRGAGGLVPPVLQRGGAVRGARPA